MVRYVLSELAKINVKKYEKQDSLLIIDSLEHTLVLL